MKEYQVAIIGSGPGGYVAAVRAGMNGLKTALIEKDPFLGGTCLHRGCVPTKALLHTAEIYDEIKHASDHGISVSNLKLDIIKAQERKQSVVDKMAKGVQFLMKKRKVDVHTGTGSFVDKNTIRVAGDKGAEEIRAEKIVIATGSVPADLPHIKADGKTIINSDHILQLEEIPKSMAVIGSGAVGSEFASIFASFGTEVHLIELLPRLLPIEDDECSKELERAFRKRGITSYTATEVTAVKTTKNGATLTMKQNGKESTLDVSKVLLAAGRRPMLDGLGHEALGVAMDRRFVAVDEYMQTNVPGIYAIGDVVPTPALAHVGSKEGILAVDHISGKPVHPIDYAKVPNCTYSSPEVASVGMTERAAKEAGIDYRVGKFPFSANGRARAMLEKDGFVKVLADAATDRVLGVHIMGPFAGELIAEACVLMEFAGAAEDLGRICHAHPTLSEAVKEAAMAAWWKPIHI